MIDSPYLDGRDRYERVMEGWVDNTHDDAFTHTVRLSDPDRSVEVRAVCTSSPGYEVQEASARQAHAFIARHFRDFVRDSVWRTPIKVDSDDTAWLKLGLGWRKRAFSEGGDIRERENCSTYLNATVRQLEDEVCEDLQKLDRRAVIMFALQNHESAILDRDNWRRTAAGDLPG